MSLGCGVMAEAYQTQVNCAADIRLVRIVAVAGSSHGGQTGVGFHRTAETTLLTEHDVLRIGGTGLPGGLLDDIRRQRPSRTQ